MMIEFPLPDKVWSVNEVPNSVRDKIRLSKRKQAWRDAAYYATHQALRTEQDFVPGTPSSVQVVIPFTVRRVRDPHNYVGTVVKAIVDGMKLAKLWPDDNPEYVTVLEPVLLMTPGEQIVSVSVVPRLEP